MSGSGILKTAFTFGSAMFALVSTAGVAAAQAPVPAAAPADVGRSLTLEGALQAAEEASPLVRRARAERDAVAARDVGASIWMPANPLISGGAGPRREATPPPVERGLQYFLHAEQTFEIANQRGARREVVSRALHTAELRLVVARAETRARVRSAYVATQLALALVDEMTQREALVSKLLEAVRARVAGGASSNVDLELARMERGRAARARVDATLASADAVARLRLLIGLAPAQRLALDATPSSPVHRAEPLPVLLERARAQRAELAALGSGIEEIDADIVRLKRERIPSPTVFVDLQRDLPGTYFIGGGLAVPIPVWRRQQGELALARADRYRVEEERTLVGRDVALEVERAFQAEVAQREMTQLLGREVLPAADAAVTLMTEGWRAGKFDLFRLLQTSRDASEARRLYLETLGLLWESSIELDRAVGTP
jgi:cobalt-zinc-cadmium efflux system outer membrane protein